MLSTYGYYYCISQGIMSDKALKDLNTLPEAERNNETFSNGNFTKPRHENIGENLEESLRKNDAPSVETPLITNGEAKSGPDVVVIEVEYVESENLFDVEDVDMSLKVRLSHFPLCECTYLWYRH